MTFIQVITYSEENVSCLCNTADIRIPFSFRIRPVEMTNPPWDRLRGGVISRQLFVAEAFDRVHAGSFIGRQ